MNTNFYIEKIHSRNDYKWTHPVHEVLTPLNECVINDPELWTEIMGETPLKRWATPEEIAEWAYFLTVKNSFCTGQTIAVDGGESINFNFVWKY